MKSELTCRLLLEAVVSKSYRHLNCILFRQGLLTTGELLIESLLSHNCHCAAQLVIDVSENVYEWPPGCCSHG